MNRKAILKLILILVPFIGLCYAIYHYFDHHISVTPYNIIPVEKKVPNNGRYKTYYGDGSIKSEAEYHMGKKDGKEVLYHKDSTRKQVNHYRHGIRNGFSYDYTKTGKLYSVTLYVEGEALKSHIVNDSVYKHEVTIGSYGEKLFNNSCSKCHNKKLTSITQIPDSLALIDTSTTKSIFNIDTVHYYLLDSAMYKNYLNRDTTVSLEEFDLKALEFFLNKEMKKADRIKVFRTLNPKSKPL